MSKFHEENKSIADIIREAEQYCLDCFQEGRFDIGHEILQYFEPITIHIQLPRYNHNLSNFAWKQLQEDMKKPDKQFALAYETANFFVNAMCDNIFDTNSEDDAAKIESLKISIEHAMNQVYGVSGRLK